MSYTGASQIDRNQRLLLISVVAICRYRASMR
jgi:hypothetical protein